MFKDNAVEEALNYTVDLLTRLISVPTVAPAGDHYEEAAEILAKELSALKMETEVIKVPAGYQGSRCRGASNNPRFIVFAKRGSGGKRLHFNGHYDVVPGGSGWTVTEPFKPVVKDGKVYGRGASDMKGGVAITVGALKLLSLLGYEPKLTIEAAFVPDEEIGGQCGTGYLVESMEKVPEYVMLPEPSGLAYPWHGHRGILWARVVVKGLNAHGSRPWLGKNAFLLGSQLALELHRLMSSTYSSRRSKYKLDVPEAAMPTAMIGGEAGVPGGGKTNQVPGEFFFTIDRRLIPEENVKSALEELKAMVSWASLQLGVEYEIHAESTVEPAISEPGELYEALKRAARGAGIELEEPRICSGGLDMWYYTTRGSKALSYGPQAYNIHGPNEHVPIEELRKLVITYAGLVVELDRVLGAKD
ncbi:MAG: M20 family metallopeptidase [Acidilobaceae archaeon]|nr:M20 family metallopeptidase [Acidilobaceae archaeon]